MTDNTELIIRHLERPSHTNTTMCSLEIREHNEFEIIVGIPLFVSYYVEFRYQLVDNDFPNRQIMIYENI